MAQLQARLWKSLGDLGAELSRTLSGRCGSEVWRIELEIALDAGEGRGRLLGSITVVQGLPRTLHFLQNIVRGSFPVDGLGVLIPPIEKLSKILLQCLDRWEGSMLQAFTVHLPKQRST